MAYQKISQTFWSDAQWQKLSNFIYFQNKMSKQLPRNLRHAPSYIDSTIVIYIFPVLYVIKKQNLSFY